MSKSTVAAALRQRISKAAQHRCGYCLTQELIIGMPMVIDHIIPESKDGPTIEENLWLACRRCNEYKATQTHAVDPQAGQTVPLFNPRTQTWADHFQWIDDGIHIHGTTPIGRATVIALKLNNDYIVRSRKRWVSVGWHPPKDIT